ncbi:MAG: N-acetyl-gamma-glutamyl-phosphate reductase, partial [Nitrososphaerota archaeon]
MFRVGIVGASGYTGGELLRILSTHPDVEVTIATSREFSGKPISYVHVNLRKHYTNLKFSNVSLEEILSKSDIVFMNTPPGVSHKLTPKLLENGLKVIDLSPDFRLKNIEEFKLWYGFEHPYPDLLKKAVYGLPELHREELRGATLIAVPGCNATASIISLIPLVKNKVIDFSKIVIDVKVGSSEAGWNPSKGSHHPEREGAIRPYDAEGHRHVAEVEQELSVLANEEIEVS